MRGGMGADVCRHTLWKRCPLLGRDAHLEKLEKGSSIGGCDHIYIYMILAQPGLTLEREARSIIETMYSGNGFAFVLTLASHCHDMGFAPILTSTLHSF